MKSKYTSRALRGMAVATAMFCLMSASAHAQTAATPTMPPAPAADKAAQVIEIPSGTGDIMPSLGTKTHTQTKTLTKTLTTTTPENGTNAETAREYTVAPGEETHPPVRLTPDSTEMVALDDDASNIIIGNPAHVNILLSNSRTLLLAPRQPGATQFTILNAAGKVVMRRHVIVSGPKENYVRIRRTCTGGGAGCEPTTVYYCPDICHDVRLLAGQANNNGQPGEAIPAAPGEASDNGAANIDGVADDNGDDEAQVNTDDDDGQNISDEAASDMTPNE